jgi:hypothetical protein
MHAKHYIYGRIYGRTLNASARFQGFELVTQCRKFKAVKVYLLKQKLSVLMLTGTSKNSDPLENGYEKTRVSGS